MLVSLKSENETLHADHEDLISKFQSSERGSIFCLFSSSLIEWTQRYNNLTEELQAQKTFQLQTQSNHEVTEGEFLLLGNAQNS